MSLHDDDDDYNCLNHMSPCPSAQFAPCPVPQVDDREAKRDTPEEGELRDQRMEITIQNSPYTREGSTEDRCVNVGVGDMFYNDDSDHSQTGACFLEQKSLCVQTVESPYLSPAGLSQAPERYLYVWKGCEQQ